jgi:hypothetical protein
MQHLLLFLSAFFTQTARFIIAVSLSFLLLSQADAQTQDLTVVVLVNSANTTDYNTSPTSPGTFQKCVERYLVHLQMPYRIVDVSQTAAQNLNSVQLIIAAHNGLNPSAAWQSAILNAVAGGTGFVNFDGATSIGQQTHIRTIFSATGATVGSIQQWITIPQAMQPGGTTPHYIDAMQLLWAGDSKGDITYNYLGTGSAATILTGAKATVVAELGTDPLILATTYGSGRAVDFTSYDYMHPTQLGFVQGVDDLFWRSLVWAARKPFVMRGYPRLTAVQMDDNDVGIMTRLPDLWNTSFTGTIAADGTGGPWTPQLNMQLASVASGAGSDRAPMIAAIKAGQLRVSTHGINYGSGGDFYWNITVPNTDSQWQANVSYAQQWLAGSGGSDTFPPFSRAIVGHYWDISNNSGFEMYNTLGTRYITAAFAPGAYYWNLPRTLAQRLPRAPFRIFEQPPEYSGDEEESYPYFYADDLTVGSVSGKPAQKFYTFGSQVLFANGRFPRNDATFPSSTNGFTVAQSLNQWEYTMWHFWAGMMPVQLYTHDDDNMNTSTAANRQSFITQLSQWCATNHCQHMFMDQMGDYLRARSHSLLSTASLNGTTLTLNFTGAATDADGNLIDTKTYVFYGDTEGSLLDVPGFANGASYNFSTSQSPSLQILPTSLTFASTVGTSPASQNLTIANIGSGTLTWSVTSNATWLTASPTSGSQGANVTVTANNTGLTAGTYNASLTFTSPGANNSPQIIPVSFTLTPAASLVVNPTSLTFSGTAGGSAPPSQTISITNPSGTNLAWTATSSVPWLTFTSNTGGTPGSLIVTATPGSLANGTYNGTVTLTPTSGSAVLVPVTFTLAAPAPTFTAAPSSLSFTAVAGSVSAPQPINLASTPSSVTWSSSSNVPWLTVTPTSGASTPSSPSVSASAATLTAGVYSGAITFTPSAGTAVQVPVTFTVTSTPTFTANPTTLSFTATVGATASSQPIALASTPASVSWSASSNAAWLTATPTTGTATPASVSIGASAAALTAGTYNGIVTMTPSAGPAVQVSVTFTVSATPTFTVNPATLSFTATVGATAPSQSVALASNPASVSWSASSNAAWLTATPTTGTATPASVSVGASAAALNAGTYNGVVTLTPSAGPAVQVSVTFTVSSVVTPTFTANPTTLSFTAAAGGSAAAQPVALASTPASVSWSTASNAVWLTATPATGAATPANLSISASAAALTTGTYNGIVTITPSAGPVVQVSVTFTVTPAVTPTFTATPASLSFAAAPGAVTGAQTVNLASTPSSVSWTASSSVPWLNLSASSGPSTPASFTVTASAATLTAGSYTGVITISPSAGPAAQVNITFTVTASRTAVIAANPKLFDMFAAVGASPPAVTTAITNTGTGTMAWTATSDSTWLAPTPPSASAPGTLTLTPSTVSLASGNQVANVTVASPNATNNQVVVPVTLHLGTSVFSDNFPTGDKNWTASPLGLASGWSILNNTFHYNGGGHTQQYTGSSSWTNYIVSTNFALANLNDYPGGLRGRVNLSTGASYAAWIYPTEKVIKLWRTTAWDIDTSGLTLLGTSPTLTMTTSTHGLRIAFAGNQITVYYDNVLIITATDSTLAAGAIALDVSNRPITFSNVSVLQQ